MNKEEFVKRLKYLGVAFNHNFTEEEASVYYDFMKGYSLNVFNNSIKQAIEESKFLPKISDLKTYCDQNKEKVKYDILETMNIKGYFKSKEEYDKATMFLENRVIPNWFKEDMKKYKQEMLEERKLIA